MGQAAGDRGARLAAKAPAGKVRRQAPGWGVRSIWAYDPVITRRLARACHETGLELIAWTVDEPQEMRRLRDLGVDGICTNDPRLFAELDR